MTKGIGWDIGIKNLAYCVLDSGAASNSPNAFLFNDTYYDISNWADISLVSQIESNLEISGQVSHINTNLKCCFPKAPSKKKGKAADINATNASNSLCGNVAYYCYEDINPDGSYKGLCKTHYKKETTAAPSSKFPELTVKKCWSDGCEGKPIQVLKAHIYKGHCKKHINEMLKSKTHSESDFLKINRAKTTSKIDINHLGLALFQELDKRKVELIAPSIILLENQPVLKNPTMKSMQMFLYSYYLIRMMEILGGIDDKKIQCYCASKKLDLIKFIPEVEKDRIITFIDTVKKSYQKNKKMAIMMVEVLLSNNAKWSDFFKSHSKQDDLADSLLMTLHYFEKGNLMKVKNDEKKADKKGSKKEKEGKKKSRKGKKDEAEKDNEDVEDNE